MYLPPVFSTLSTKSVAPVHIMFVVLFLFFNFLGYQRVIQLSVMESFLKELRREVSEISLCVFPELFLLERGVYKWKCEFLIPLSCFVFFLILSTSYEDLQGKKLLLDVRTTLFAGM